MTSMQPRNEAGVLELVRKFVLRDLHPGQSIPGDEEDLVEIGVIDSMGWVGVISAIEEATGIRNFGNPWPTGRTQSIRSLVEAVHQGVSHLVQETRKEASPDLTGGDLVVSLVGWGSTLGALKIEAVSIERECGLAPGTIHDRAGIEFVRRADKEEDEVTLGQSAAGIALKAASMDAEDVDFVVTTSATFLNFPSLAAVLHTGLLVRESCGALDVGGACVGLLHALATAKALLSDRKRRVTLVVASEVHSRRLSSPEVPGEFRGLFGDGACAFVLARPDTENGKGMTLGDFVWGCSGTFASSLRLAMRKSGELDVVFKGEQLATAALSTLDRVVDNLENLSGRRRSEVDWFALHEPNPRLAEIFSKKSGIPMQKIPLISKTSGNLGSATCGVSLCTALDKTQATRTSAHRPLIYVAAVGPGILWGGTYLH